MKVAIAGYGIEGKTSYKYWNCDGNEVTIVDERSELPGAPDDARVLVGEDVFSQLEEFDLIIRSPSINPKRLPYGDRVWSATNEFFEKSPAQVIGVTGTKGKGTTSSFIYEILKAAGKDVHLVGNIGVPALEILPKLTSDSIVVYELSSFQLWDIRKSPHVAVVLPIEPDHLDVHDDLNDYIQAKANITRYQAAHDVVIFNKNNTVSVDIGHSSQGNKIEYPFGIESFESSIRLPGRHNIENASSAIAAVRIFDIDDAVIHRGLASFAGLPHRLQFVATVDEVSFYDDSISTTPGSAIAAIYAFSGKPIVLILGGHEKGADYGELMQLCHDEQVTVIAMGANRDKLGELCAEHGVEYGIEPSEMRGVVHRARMEAKAKDSVVILSPAAASFDMFKNYADRGDQFIAAVNQLRAT